MIMSEDNPALPAKFVAGICAHVNEDHRFEMTLIASRLLGCTDATDAYLVDIRRDGFSLEVVEGGTRRKVDYGFERPLCGPADWRPSIIEIIGRARDTLPG